MWWVPWESYSGSKKKVYISPTKIRKMKKNMQKVPKIQEKAEKYSSQEEKIVDTWFDENLKKIEE